MDYFRSARLRRWGRTRWQCLAAPWRAVSAVRPTPHTLPPKTPASVDQGSIWLLSGDPTPRNEWLSKELMWHLIFKSISFSPIQNQPRMSALRTKLVLSACTSKSCYVVLKNQFSFEVKLFWNFYYYLRNCYLSLKILVVFTSFMVISWY